MAITYIIEAGYLALSVGAWCILSSPDPDGDCANNAASLIELIVDMIILLYMRSLRLLSIALFLIVCGPLLLICYYQNRPKPPQDAAALRRNFCKVTISDLKKLRAKNYRHKLSEIGERSESMNSLRSES